MNRWIALGAAAVIALWFGGQWLWGKITADPCAPSVTVEKEFTHFTYLYVNGTTQLIPNYDYMCADGRVE